MVDVGNAISGPLLNHVPLNPQPYLDPNSLAYVPQPLLDLLAEARQTNALLKSILDTLAGALNGAKPQATKPDPEPVAWVEPDLGERVAWLERQIAELKERR